jgi:hypothetical protein
MTDERLAPVADIDVELPAVLVVPAPFRRVHDAARDDGPGRGLQRMYGGADLPADRVVRNAFGHAVVPAATWRRVGHRWPEATLVPHPVLRGVDLVALHGLTSMGSGDPHRATVADLTWSVALGWLRCGVSTSLLDTALRYLTDRCVEGGVLLDQQLVRGALADVVADHLDVRATLAHLTVGGLASAGDRDRPESTDPRHASALAEAHDRLTLADRTLVRLLGASGFTVDGAGRGVYVSEFLADVYVSSPFDVRLPGRPLEEM